MTTPATSPRPPALARRLLERVLPDDVRDEVLGDLEQQFHEQASGASRWYWRRALAYALPFAAAGAADLLSASVAGWAQPGWTQDLRHAWRSLARAWTFSLTTIAILGSGLGAATAIFSIYHGVLLRPFPYAAPDALVRIDWLMPAGQSLGSSLGDVALWTQASRALSDVGLFSNRTTEIRGSGPAETVQVAYVNVSTLPLLGVPPQIGRLFAAGENVPGGDVYKAILGDALWRRRFGQDPHVIGQTLSAGNRRLEIVGVMPRGFDFPNGAEIWIPVESDWATSAPSNPRRSTVRIYGVIGRLRTGATPSQARDELSTLAREAVQQQADAVPRVRTWREAETAPLQPYLVALAGSVACLLLICVANASSLQLARGAARQREFAVRTAIGASMGRNLRIQFLESLLLAAGGALCGGAVAYAGVHAIRSWIPVTLPSWMQIALDARALLFCGVTAVVASVLSGLVPAWRASAGDSNRLLAGGGRGRTDRAGFRQLLVAGQIGLSVMLLVSALLLVQTLSILRERDPGFRRDGLLTIKVSRTYGDGTRLDRAQILPALHARVLERLAALPGVLTASLSSRVPFAGGPNSRTVADLFLSGTAGDASRKASFSGLADVSPAYFETMGIRLLRGRGISMDDTPARDPVIVINERAAQVLWPDAEALGQRITWGPPRPDNPSATVIGVVANVRSAAADADRALDFYYPYAQYPADSIYYVLRTSVPPESLIETTRRTIQEVEPSIAVAAIKPLQQWIDESLWQTQLWGRLLALFAGVALLLAAVGLYGVVSYVVLQRSREIVIRLSMGATNGQVARLMIGRMLRVIVVGVGAGLAGSFAVSRVIGALLFQVSPTDLVTYAAVAAVVTGAALLACGPPILRATRVNPASVLNEQ